MTALEKAARALEARLKEKGFLDYEEGARAVISSIEVDDAMDVVMLLALARHGVEPDVQELLTAGNPMRGIRPHALRAALTASLRSILEDGAGT